jgi:hypothetical protein
MPTLWDRLLGREQTAAKAVVGTGAYWMEHGVPLRSFSKDPVRRMAEALALYTNNDHVYTCESLIGDKFSTVAWHLERDGETIDNADAAARQCSNLIRFGSIDPLVYEPMQSRSERDLLVSRHMGLPGTAFLYLDQVDDNGIPARMWTLTPSRLTPRQNARGVLGGWIVDADRPNELEPIPLVLEEVIRVMLQPSDYGHFGIGNADALWRKAGLSNSAAGFAEGTMISGGRKAHMIWPEAGITVEGEAWDQWVNGLRSANEDGSFTRRLTANRFPVGSIETGQSLADIGVTDISNLAQADIYAVEKVPGTQVGREGPAGLNSGERGKYEEAALWQNAIEPRLQRYADALQNRIVDKFGLTLILETPEFDDDAPLYDIASKAKDVPLKVDERRALVGLDPLDERVYGQLGQMILIANTITELTEKQAIPDNLIPFTGGNQQTGATDDDDEEMPAPGEISGKAKLVFTDLRKRVDKQYQPKAQTTVQAALEAQAAAIATKVITKYDHLVAKPGDVDAWWNESHEHQRLESALDPIITALVNDSGRKIRSGFFAQTKADNFMDRVLAYVGTRTSERIRGINKTTRDAIRSLIAKAVTAGTGPAELGQQIRDLTQFNPARAEVISRTETALAYNDAAIGTYRAFDVGEVQAIDGDQDEECAARNGNIYTLTEASGITDHPNGTLDWVPIVKGRLTYSSQEKDMTPSELKAILEAVKSPPVSIHLPSHLSLDVPAPQVNVTMPEQEAPNVTVNVPEQTPPTINVPTPFVNVEMPAKATTPQEVTVVRDASGQVIGSVETDD